MVKRLLLVTLALLCSLPGAAYAQVSRVGVTFYAIAAGSRGTSVAYDSKNDVYLVVSAYGVLRGRFVTADGIPVGTDFVIQSTSNFTHFPRVAFSPHGNGGAGAFLVTWHETDAGDRVPTAVHSRMVGYPGTLLGTEQKLSPNESWFEAGPPVAYSTGDQEFLVLWRSLTPNDIRAIRVSNTGMPLGSAFSITTNGEAVFEDHASVAYNPDLNEFMVVYAGYTNSSTVTSRRIKSGTGAFVGAAQTVAGAGAIFVTDVQYNGAGRFLAVWYQDPPKAVYGVLLNSDGSAAGSVIPLSSRYRAYDALSLAFNPVAGSYFAISHDSVTSEDGGVEVNGAGNPLTTGIQVTVGGGTGNFYPRIAAHTSRKEWLAVAANSFTSTIAQRLKTDFSGGGGTTPPPPPPPPPVEAPPRISAVAKSPTGNSMAGTPITFSVTALGGPGPLQFQFWRYSYTRQTWTVAQAWSSNAQHTWTPSALDAGWQKYQIWVRAGGATGDPAHWMDLNPFLIQTSSPKLLSFRVGSTNTSGSGAAAPVNSQVNVNAVAAGGMTGILEYQFWRFNTGTGRWSLDRPWGNSPNYTWTPAVSDEGTHYFQVWVREYGKSDWEDWMSTELHVSSITATSVTPYTANIVRGTPLNFVATAAGSDTGYEYKFWRYNVQGGAWVVAREYSSNNTFQWISTTGELGDNYFQVWVRRAGSNASYAAWISTGLIRVQ